LTAKWELANEAEEAAAITLCSYPCQTIEEARAKAEYISGSPLIRAGLTDEQIEVLLGSFSGGDLGASSVQNLHPDEELIALGDEFERSWDLERSKWDVLAAEADDAIVAEIVMPCSSLSERILAKPAHTLAGLRVKARVVLWCQGGEFEGFGSETTDERLIESIVRDLLTLSNVSETAI
jgi:hypothetical protein